MEKILKSNAEIIAKLNTFEENDIDTKKEPKNLRKEIKDMNEVKSKSTEQDRNTDAHKKNENSLQCNICDFVAASNNMLRKHINMKHPEDTTEKKFFECKHRSDSDCTLCKDKFVTENDLSIHIEEHLKEIEGIDFEGLKNGHDHFECSQCRFKCNDEYKVKKHLVSHVLQTPVQNTKKSKIKERAGRNN